MSKDAFDLAWYIVFTEAGVREFIPDYTQSGSPPFLILTMGDKGCMVWPIELMQSILEGYRTALEKAEYIMKDVAISA